MALSFKLGQTREDREKQEAEQIREMELNINEKNQRRQRKIATLNRRSKRNKIIVICVFSLLCISLLVFGTYNTFFKKTITMDDVVGVVTSRATFDSSGVEGFLYERIDSEIYSYFRSSETVKEFKFDKNSLRIDKIMPINNETALIYFSGDMYITEVDIKERDKEGKEIIIPGQEYKESYTFYTIIMSNGSNYAFGSKLGLIESTVILSSNTDNTTSAFLSFEGVPADDDAVMITKRTKVERILSDIYQDKTVGSDFESTNALKFKKDHAEFKGITQFISYTGTNPLGFNAYCEYKVQTQTGLQITKVAYITLEPNGQSYKITKFL